MRRRHVRCYLRLYTTPRAGVVAPRYMPVATVSLLPCLCSSQVVHDLHEGRQVRRSYQVIVPSPVARGSYPSAVFGLQIDHVFSSRSVQSPGDAYTRKKKRTMDKPIQLKRDIERKQAAWVNGQDLFQRRDLFRTALLDIAVIRIHGARRMFGRGASACIGCAMHQAHTVKKYPSSDLTQSYRKPGAHAP